MTATKTTKTTNRKPTAKAEPKFHVSVHATNVTKGEDQVADLIRVGLETCSPTGRVNWDDIKASFPGELEIGYSRGWCVVRRAWIEANAPQLLHDVELAALAADAMARKGSEFNLNVDVLGPVARQLRDEDQLSWGEIAVRMNIPESKVRAAYRTKAGHKDLGLRIGKGGRFVADRGDLYVENMKAEGVVVDAALPRSTFRTMDRSAALNYRAPEQAKPVRKAATKKVAAKAS